MADQRDLVVRFIGDDRDLQRAFTNTERRAVAFDGRMSRVNQSLRGGIFGSGIGARGALLFGSGAFIGTATATAALTETIRAASDLNEEVSKSREVFGASADEIRAWSETTAASLGIARNEALRASGTFGNLFRVVGLGPDQAAEMSQELVKLAADLASFNNASPEEVLLALRSGLIGEAEPLRRFGVLLSEARVQQEAMSATGKRSVAALTNQEKTLARFNIILRDTAPAQGDFARTSEGLANQSKILRARLNNLAADIGVLLIPVLTDAAEAAGLLFDALDKLRGVDFTPGFDLPDIPDELDPLKLAPFSQAGAIALVVKRFLDDEKQAADAVGRAVRSERGADAVQGLADLAKQRNDAAAEAERDFRQARRRFAAFTRGMGLKLDAAQLTATLDDDIRALQAFERAIERQIRREGRTFALVEQLTQVRLQLADVVAQRAEEAADRSQQEFETLIDTLDLNLDRARVTADLTDDLRALAEIEQALIRRIAAEGRTVELERRLFDIRQQQADTRRRQTQGRQFEALGLTADGDERTPSTGTLRRRLRSLRQQLAGTPLDTDQTRAQLRRIARVLAGEFGNVGKEVRAAIKRMFDDIADALKQGERDGPLTEFEKTSTRKLTEGLGLSASARRELRFRLSQVGRGGTVPERSIFGQPSVTSTAGDTIIINGDIVVDGDNPDAFMRALQNKAKKRSATRTGRRRGRRTGTS